MAAGGVQAPPHAEHVCIFASHWFAVDKETDRVEWVKALQAAVDKASSNERISLMANLQEVTMFCLLRLRAIILILLAFQSRRTDQLLQKHLFKQDAFAERFQTKFDQETITSEVLNSRYFVRVVLGCTGVYWGVLHRGC